MSSNARAIILAAGRGSRMGDATASAPKCFTELGGKTLLAWQLEALRAAGISDIAIVTGYLSECFEGRADTLFHNSRWAQTNMVESLASAASWLSEGPCIISYADIVYRPEPVQALLASDDPIAITFDRQWRSLWELRLDDPASDAETFRRDGDGRLIEIGGKVSDLDAVDGQFMGLLRIAPPGWEAICKVRGALPDTDRDRQDCTTLLQRLLDDGVPIGTVPVEGGWCEVDTESDRDAYVARLAQPQPWSHDWRS